jgi:signal transduction histidine kinase
MKLLFKIFFLILLPGLALAQNDQRYEDSLLTALKNAPNDTVRMDINRTLGFYHQGSDVGKALVYYEAQLALAKKLNINLWEADAYQQIGFCNTRIFKLTLAYENYMQALKIAEDPSSAANIWGYSSFSYSKTPEEARGSIIGMIHLELFDFYNRTRNQEEAFKHILKSLEIGESLNNQKILSLANRDIGIYYFNNNKPDSAFIYFKKALVYYQNSPYQKLLGTIYLSMGRYYSQERQYDSAKFYYHKGMDVTMDPASIGLLGTIQRSLGNVFIETGQLDSALVYTLQAQKLAGSINDLPGKALSLTQLGTIYQLKKEYSVAYDYLKKGKDLGDTLANSYTDRLIQFQNLDFEQKIRLQELEKEKQQEKSRNRMYAMLLGFGIFLLVALLLYRNNRQKQKANIVLEKTLSNLKSTQTQLVQSEKMASLGELTAGIAHEIQNPLNFVNNFSEVNSELIGELVEEVDKGNTAEVKLIAADIKENSDKINHHGQRAGEIVKGMLQHSRSSSGVKEPTDINALCDEYLRLSYHGLRAKDKSFNATMKTDFDSTIGSINIIPQDIGRVMLNLVNNAFYVVDEKKKTGIAGYEPTVTIATRYIQSPGDRAVEIKVSDNGGGIPPSIKEKIFQPFFTTKPTGQGTGLGLSLSYDIIKAHGGEIQVETKEGEGSAFIIQLPVNS